MREVIFKVRRNPGNLSSIDDFIHWKGNGSNSSREVYFLRMKGMDAGRLREVARMDQALAEEMRAGKGFYYRGNQLPRLSAREEADYYSGCGFLTLVNGIIWPRPQNCGFFYVKFIKI